MAYLYVALEQGYKGNTGMLIAYLGYAFANVGLYMLASKWLMKEPKKIKLTDNPVAKDVKKIPLTKDNFLDGADYKKYWQIFFGQNENNSKNNSEGL